jgi:CCR4-NOT complex subunit CAF16
MPVPVAATHKARAPAAAAAHSELPTAGPFARLGAEPAVPAAVAPAASAPAREGAAAERPAPAAAAAAAAEGPALETRGLSFWYPDTDGRPIPGAPAVVRDMTVSLPRGATCLLVGPNGAGKTTLLKVLAGKHMVPEGAVSALGAPPFHATALTTRGALAYVGGNWERDVAFAGYSVPLAGDVAAGAMLAGVPGADPARRARLLEVLDVDPSWRMHRVSDGQRRRVQLAMGLLRPFSLLLLDEVTVDLDVLGRADLMAYLRAECAERGATVVYATHIFDGLEGWPSHLLYVAGGRLRESLRAEEVPELREGRLLELVARWLRAEKAERDAAAAAKGPALTYGGDGGSALGGAAQWNNGFAAGRLTSSMKLSSNAVMRM